MTKKIILATTLLFTVAHAEIDQTGFFVGIDAGYKATNIDYKANEDNWKASLDIKNLKTTPLSYKLGYQYYFTRVYALITKNNYEEESKNKYNIDTSTFEMNADYIPLFYINTQKTWSVRGIFGLSMGYNKSKITNNLSTAEEVKPVLSTDTTQRNMVYGAQIGMMSEFDFGLILEFGYRYRQGLLMEFTDDTSNAEFTHDSSEYYLGINYLF